MNRLAAKTLLLLAVLSLLATAFAADETPSLSEGFEGCSKLTAVESAVPHSAEWICAIARVADSINLFAWIDGIAWAVLLVFFVGRTLSLSLDPNAGAKLRVFLTAAMFGFALMLSLTPIRSAMLDLWQYSYTFSHDTGANAVWEALADMSRQIDPDAAATAIAASEVVPQMGSIVGGVAGGTAVGLSKGKSLQSAMNVLKATSQGAGKALRGIPLMRIIDAVLLPIMALYSMIIFGSALAVIIGAWVLPIGAIMILAGSGGAFLGHWTKVMLGAVLTMVVFPLMWGVTAQVAIVTPLTGFLHDITEVVDEYEQTVQAIAEGGGIGITRAFERWIAAGGAGLKFFGNIMGMLVQFVLGLITAIGLIFLLQTLVQKFVGGISAQAKGMTGAMLGLKGRGGSAKGGKGDAESSQMTTTTTKARGGASGGGTGNPETIAPQQTSPRDTGSPRNTDNHIAHVQPTTQAADAPTIHPQAPLPTGRMLN